MQTRPLAASARLFAAMIACFTASFAWGDVLQSAFTNPPVAARPWVYWYWMDGNVTRDGITKDLEAMKQVGIGGAYLFSIATGRPGTKSFVARLAESLTPYWWSLVTHALNEARRLDLKLGLNACDGWATASGPWITPEFSMQKVVWSAVRTSGSTNFEDQLPLPPSNLNYYRDIAVFAFPTPPGADESSRTRRPKVTTNIRGIDPEQVLVEEGAVETDIEGWIQYEFDAPFTCRAIRILPKGVNYQPNRLEIQASDDGQAFRSLGRLVPPRHGWQDAGTPITHSIPETTARYYRFVYDRTGSEAGAEDLDSAKFSRKLKVSLIELLGEPVLNQVEGKSGLKWRWGKRTTLEQLPDSLCVPSAKILNLTSNLSSDGQLKWVPPEGNWTILRLGCTTTGQESAQGGAGKGLECDKFNPAAVRIQFDHWLGEALNRTKVGRAGETIWMAHVDSWESDSQNWSPVFQDEFQKRRGYDPIPYLPAMAGVPIESADISERFLFDVRRTIAELVADNFFKPLVTLGHQNGYQFSAEAVAPTMMSDGMLHHGVVDFPMGEFWLRSPTHDKPTDIADAVSGAHIYGKPIVQAEAFTELRMKWDETPAMLKPVGDHNFCAGINRFVLHVFAQQPDDRLPGVTLSSVGTHFARSQSWWRQSRPWMEYVTRCQALLQAGKYVADVCYFTGEDLPSRALIPAKLNPALPAGYAYDSINRDALMNRASAKDGRLVLPDGMSYGVLVLPETRMMTPELTAKIRDLVGGGVTVVGPKPTHSPSLEGYPECDRRVREIADEMWGSDGVGEDRLGGHVIAAARLEEVFSRLELQPDVLHDSEGIEWLHRRSDEADWYFISNQESVAQTVAIAFRIGGRVPELWDTERGVTEEAAVWREEDGRTIVPVRFSPSGSIFVVFRKLAGNGDHIVGIQASDGVPSSDHLPHGLKLSRNGNEENFWADRTGEWKLNYVSGVTKTIRARQPTEEVQFSGPWSVGFPPSLGAPPQIKLDELASLTRHSVHGVRHFSGTATYSTEFNWKPATSSASDQRVLLDLGAVAELAEVRLNNEALGIFWRAPFVAEVTDKLRSGRNQLAIEVTTTWQNRLIGDAALPVDQRVTWSSFSGDWFPPNAPLAPAGLIGPVKLTSMSRATLVTSTPPSRSAAPPR